MILEARHFKTYFPLKGGLFGRVRSHVRAVDDVTLQIPAGELTAVVGESGCGKSTLGLSLLGIVPPTAGELHLLGRAVPIHRRGAWKPFRKDFQIIFQDPFTALNPRQTVFQMLARPLLAHGLASRRNVRSAVTASLTRVGLAPDYMDRFPHAFSGGQRQRIAIARAIALEPRLLVCDEVVSALDVSVQAQIIRLLLDLKDRLDLTLLFIAHDLALVRVISDRIHVMYLGRILESAPAAELFRQPRHPYTRALIDAIPSLDRHRRPKVLEGEVPSPLNPPAGCVFRNRCFRARPRCAERMPDLTWDQGRAAACYFPL